MIISQNTACAGNRIKSWVSAMRLAEVVQDYDVRVYWPTWLECLPIPGTERLPEDGYANFSDLFKNDVFLDWRPTEEKGYVHLPFGVGENWYFDNLYSYGRAKFLVFPEDKLDEGFIKNPFSRYQLIDHQYGRIPENIVDNYMRQFKRIEFDDSITERVDKFPEFPENTVSVQIRTWCNSKARYPFFDINMFIEAMDSYASNCSFFLCSDSQPVIEELKEKYGDRIITFDNKVPIDCDSKDALRDAMAEMQRNDIDRREHIF